MDASQTVVPKTPPKWSRPIRVGVVGGGVRAALLVGMLHDVEGATVVSLLANADPDPSVRLARDLGVPVARDVETFVRDNYFDVVIEAGDEESPVRDADGRPVGGLEIAGGAACQLLLDLFATRRLGIDAGCPDDQPIDEAGMLPARSLGVLSSEAAGQTRSGAAFDEQLAEMFFAHEFSKVLARYTSVDDACSLMVDGLTGLLGAEISCAYLLDSEGGSLRLQACQGLSPESLAATVPVHGTFLGVALHEGCPVQEHEVVPGSFAPHWTDSSPAIGSQAAVPLVAAGQTMGVALVAFRDRRELTEIELERFEALAEQAAVTLKSALLLAEVERSSVTDRLTQLYNESHFMRCLDAEFCRSSRFLHSLSLVVFGLDEECGAAAGPGGNERVLREIALVIRQNMRNMDIAGRRGPGTIALLLPETGLKGAENVAERIRHAVESSGILADGPRTVSCTVSGGVAGFPRHAESATQLLAAAEETLQRVLTTSRNRVEVARG